MTQSTARAHTQRIRFRGYALGLAALVTCPCHLPVLALVLAGTAAGAFLGDHLVGALALFSVLFVGFLWAAVRVLRGKTRG